MALTDAVKDMQSATAQQQAQEYLKKVAESSKNGGRKVGGDMGKEDFLMLLSAQLRHQDPLNPQSDADFSAQLAQFSSLEQMQNMNETLGNMSNYQSYSLIGKFVMAEAEVYGEFEQVSGVVESIFSNNGITYAQIGEYVVPVASISEVFDTSNILTSEMLLETSSQLIGRTIVADMGKEIGEIEGIVTRIHVENGRMLAQVDDGTDEPKFVPINAIIDIRETGTERYMPKPATPPEAVNFREDPNSDGFLEYADDFETLIGRWDWNVEQWKWLYTDLT